ncbi:MAG: hypothetical protein OXS32_01830 [Verrucomicrobiales bacterium]|nr:hypothetical protein [Verrucomicrobiales bacterium]
MSFRIGCPSEVIRIGHNSPKGTRESAYRFSKNKQNLSTVEWAAWPSAWPSGGVT